MLNDKGFRIGTWRIRQKWAASNQDWLQNARKSAADPSPSGRDFAKNYSHAYGTDARKGRWHAVCPLNTTAWDKPHAETKSESEIYNHRRKYA